MPGLAASRLALVAFRRSRSRARRFPLLGLGRVLGLEFLRQNRHLEPILVHPHIWNARPVVEIEVSSPDRLICRRYAGFRTTPEIAGHHPRFLERHGIG